MIHQPSSEVFARFDRLQLLAEGRVVFFGDAHDAGGFFARCGFPCPEERAVVDHLLHVINSDFGEPGQARCCVYLAGSILVLPFCTARPSQAKVMLCLRPLALKHAAPRTTPQPFGNSAKWERVANALPVRFRVRVLVRGQVSQDITTLNHAYLDSELYATATRTVEQATSNPGKPYHVETQSPSAVKQTLVLTERALKSNWRDVGIFWMRLVMYVGLCLCIGFLYFQMGNDWKDVYSRTALLFFVVAFLTFMSISAFPR